MLKDQNGYPVFESSSCCTTACDGCVQNNNGENEGINLTCSEANKKLIGAPLAYVYAPNQSFRMLYSAKEALAHGTLFEELYKPMEVYGNE